MRGSRFVQRTMMAGAATSALTLAPLFASASFAGSPPPSTPPNSPASVALASGNRSLGVTWTEATNGSITFVATARSPGRTTRSCTTKRDACSITALTNGLIYDVTVVAKDRGGASAPSSDVTATVGVPGAPHMVHATAGKAVASIAWAPPTASGVSKITGYMATASPGGFSCSTAATLITKAGRSCQIAGLSSGTAYSVTVTATNAFGTGAPSKPAAVTPS